MKQTYRGKTLAIIGNRSGSGHLELAGGSDPYDDAR